MDMYNSEILSYSLSTQPNDYLYRRTFHSDQGRMGLSNECLYTNIKEQQYLSKYVSKRNRFR